MKRIWNLALGTAVLCTALLCGCALSGTTAPDSAAPTDPLTIRTGRSYIALVSSVTGQELTVLDSAGQNVLN